MADRKMMIGGAILIVAILVIASAAVMLNNNNNNNNNSNSGDDDPIVVNNYPVTVDSANSSNELFSQTFTSDPKSIVSYMPQTLELLCLFGLEDRVKIAVAASSDDVCINSEVQKAYSAVAKSVGSSALPTEEELIVAQPDLIIGWHSIFNYAGEVAEWNERGCNYYVVNRPASALSDYTDMLTDIGKIFNMESKAKELIDEFNAGVALAKEKTNKLNDSEKHTAIFIEVRADGTYNLYGNAGTSSLTGNLINAAGGINLVETTTAKVSAENVDILTPDYIFILVNTSVGTDAELSAAEQAMKDNKQLATLVSQADGIKAFKLNDVFDGGVLPTDIVERLYYALYPTSS